MKLVGRYYMCSKCNKPYFGGMRRCEQNMEEEREFNPADLVRASYSNADFIVILLNIMRTFLL